MPGAILAGRYRIVALAGRGGMGEVYRADDLTLGQPVALKFLPEGMTTDPERLARFRSEVRTARQVSHPNVCRVYDIGEAGGHQFLSMEFVDGEDLGSLLRRIGRLPQDKGIEVARQICAGLAAAHERGVVHRDLKPANIMIDGRGQVRIADFGLAGAGPAADGLLGGTPAYMAPEQFGGHPATTASDIYALGLVLYEIFTGQRMFAGSTVAELATAHRERPPSSAATVVGDLDPAIDNVIQGCLAKNPAARPPTPLSVSAALPGGDPLAAALARGETPSPQLVAAAGGITAIHPALAAGALLLVVAGLMLSIWLSGSTKLLRIAPLPKSPDVLRDRAQQIVAELGFTTSPAGQAAGFRHSDFIRHLIERPPPGPAWADARVGQPSAFLFWYRQSPRPMTAENFQSAGRISPADPPLRVPGMVAMQLDWQGRLYSWQAIPHSIEEEAPAATPVDWDRLFRIAGLEIGRFSESRPQRVPPVYADARAAWTGVYPENPAIPIRVEAASLHGKPVHFEIVEPWSHTDPVDTTGSMFMFVLLVALMLAGIALAIRNVRMERGDLRGATRLAAVVFGVRLFSSAIRADYGADTAGMSNLLFLLFAQALLLSGLIWAGYVALEPHVRRRWPRVLISWMRLLSGTWRDSRIGRDVLVGLVAAIALTLAGQLSQLAAGWLGGTAQLFSYPPWVLDGGRFVIGALMQDLVGSLLIAFGLLLLFFTLTLVVRRTWAAIMIVLVLLTIPSVGAPSPVIAVPVALYSIALLAFTLLKVGLLALIVVMFTLPMIDHYPMTFDFGAWYASYGWIPIACILGLTVYAFRTALGGQPIYRGSLLKH